MTTGIERRSIEEWRPDESDGGFSPWVALALAAGAFALVFVAYRRLRAPAGRHALDRPPVTQASDRINAADADLGRPGQNVEERLDEALMETFPTSDPISLRIE
jgi:hypothetical protein